MRNTNFIPQIRQFSNKRRILLINNFELKFCFYFYGLKIDSMYL